MGRHVLDHGLADDAIAAGNGVLQDTILVDELQAQAVNLGLRHDHNVAAVETFDVVQPSGQGVAVAVLGLEHIVEG